MAEPEPGSSEEVGPAPEDAPPAAPDPEFLANPQPTFRAMAKQCPVMKMPGGMAGREGVVILGYKEVVDALRSPQIFSSNMEAINIGNQVPLIPLQIDPPNLAKYRKLLDPMFTRRKMSLLEPDVRKLANELIDAFIDKGECEFDRDFAIPLPCTVFLRLLGLPLEDLDLFLELKDGIIRPDTLDPEERDRMVDATGARIHAYFAEAMAERRERRRDDLLSTLLDAEVKGQKLSDEEIQGICYLLLIAGLDTVTATLGCGISYLAQQPEQRQRLVDDPSLIPGAIEELMRWESPVGGVARIAAQDVDVVGAGDQGGPDRRDQPRRRQHRRGGLPRPGARRFRARAELALGLRRRTAQVPRLPSGADGAAGGVRGDPPATAELQAQAGREAPLQHGNPRGPVPAVGVRVDRPRPGRTVRQRVRGSRGRPSARSAMMLRWIWLEPA